MVDINDGKFISALQLLHGAVSAQSPDALQLLKLHSLDSTTVGDELRIIINLSNYFLSSFESLADSSRQQYRHDSGIRTSVHIEVMGALEAPFCETVNIDPCSDNETVVFPPRRPTVFDFLLKINLLC